MQLGMAALQSINHHAQQEEGFSLVAVLMALGLLGFFISVAFSGLGAARMATELLEADAEFHDLRSSVYSLDLCKFSCVEGQNILKPKVGKWQLKLACGQKTRGVSAKIANPKRENEAARSKYGHWKHLGVSPGGAICSVNTAAKQRTQSAAKTKLCGREGAFLIGVDFEHETIQCR